MPVKTARVNDPGDGFEAISASAAVDRGRSTVSSANWRGDCSLGSQSTAAVQRYLRSEADGLIKLTPTRAERLV